MNPGDVKDLPGDPNLPAYFDQQAKKRRDAWNAYIDGVCKGLPEQELGKLYWRAVNMTDDMSEKAMK